MPKKVGDHSSISQLSQVGYYLLIFIGPTHMQKMIIYTKIYAKVYQGGRNLGSYIIILPTIVLPLSPYTHSQAKYTPPPGSRASLVAQRVKRLPTMLETWVQSLGWEDLLEKEMATHSSILAWKIKNGRRNLVGYNPWDHKELDTTERLHIIYIPLVPRILILLKHQLQAQRLI